MRKWICRTLAVLMLLPVFATTAIASGHGHGGGHGHCAVRKHVSSTCVKNEDCEIKYTCSDSCTYADEDHDNVCDNCENQCAGCGEAKDGNGDGICDGCGKCSHYRDDDTNGVCDHQEVCAERKQSAAANTRVSTCKRSSRHGKHHG